MSLEKYANNAVTTLANICQLNDATIAVNSILGFPTAGNFRIRVFSGDGSTDSEYMLVTGVNGNQWNVLRAIEPCGGIQQQYAHGAASYVYQVITAASLELIAGQPISEESPSGVINGINTIFTMANTPMVGTLQVYLNGLKQRSGSLNDYTIIGNVITFNEPPSGQDSITLDYRY